MKNYGYEIERVTPVEEIPLKYQVKAPLPGGRIQIVDMRRCYNWQPGENGGILVECGSVAAGAHKLYESKKI